MKKYKIASAGLMIVLSFFVVTSQAKALTLSGLNTEIATLKNQVVALKSLASALVLNSINTSTSANSIGSTNPGLSTTSSTGTVTTTSPISTSTSSVGTPIGSSSSVGSTLPYGGQGSVPPGTTSINVISKFLTPTTYGYSNIFENGNVGINTISPFDPFTVNGYLPDSIIGLSSNGSATAKWHIGIGDTEATSFQIGDGATMTPRFSIQKDTGKIGIGTTTPFAELTVNGPVPHKLIGLSSGSSTLWNIGMSDKNGTAFQIFDGAQSDFSNVNTVPLSIQKGTGNVGIGMYTPYAQQPTQKLDVNGNANVSGNITSKGLFVAGQIPIYLDSCSTGGVVTLNPVTGGCATQTAGASNGAPIGYLTPPGTATIPLSAHFYNGLTTYARIPNGNQNPVTIAFSIDGTNGYNITGVKLHLKNTSGGSSASEVTSTLSNVSSMGDHTITDSTNFYCGSPAIGNIYGIRVYDLWIEVDSNAPNNAVFYTPHLTLNIPPCTGR